LLGDGGSPNRDKPYRPAHPALQVTAGGKVDLARQLDPPRRPPRGVSDKRWGAGGGAKVDLSAGGAGRERRLRSAACRRTGVSV
jgi:hypothetical protein